MGGLNGQGQLSRLRTLHCPCVCTQTLLGQVDLAFLGTYAIGMFYAGHLGDRLDLRWFLTIGECAAPRVMRELQHITGRISPACTTSGLAWSSIMAYASWCA